MTRNVYKRLKQHNSNRSKWTKYKGPWGLIYQAKFGSGKEAREHEKYMKGGAGRKIIKMEIARVAELADAHA